MSAEPVFEVRPGSVFQGPAGEDLELLQFRYHDGEVYWQYRQGPEVYEVPVRDILPTLQAAHCDAFADRAPDRDIELLAQLSTERRRAILEMQSHVLDVIQGRPDEAGPSPYNVETTTQSQRQRAKKAELGHTERSDKVRRWVIAYRERGLAGLLHGNTRLPMDVINSHDARVVAVVRAHFDRERGASKKAVVNLYAVVLSDLRRAGLARKEGP